MNPEHCWVYIVKGSSIINPTALIAQGSIEGLDSPADLPLLGAEQGDFIVLIGNRRGSKSFSPLVLWAKITSGNSAAWTWKPATPDPFPLVDVTVTKVDPQAPPRYTIRADGFGRQWTPWFFPLGRQKAVQTDTIGDLASLDGHVMLVLGDGEADLQLVIATYSVGGSPGESAYPVGPNPLPTGSADGNAMLFFWDDDKKQIAYRSIGSLSNLSERDRLYELFKIVTVTNPINDAPSPKGWVPRSYAFSVTSNESFKQLTGLHPTLVLYYDSRMEGDPARLEVGRYDAESGVWMVIEVPKARDRDRERYLVALTLSSETAPGLFEYPPRAEHFRLFLPQATADGSAPAAADSRNTE
jgi:hypothetical protein